MTLDSVESCHLADYIYCIGFFSLYAIAITATDITLFRVGVYFNLIVTVFFAFATLLARLSFYDFELFSLKIFET